MSPSRKIQSGTRVKSRTRKREKKERFSLLLLLSLLVHATLIILLAILFAKQFGENEQKQEPPPEPPMPEVTLEIPPPDTSKPKERPFMEAKEIADKAPEKAPFQSDENTKAASDLPPTGNTPLPSQQGVIQPNLELRNQQYTPGEEASSSAGNPAPPQPLSPPAPPTLPDQQKPKVQSTPDSSPAPTATPESSATPEPIPTAPPPPNSLKLLDLPKEQPRAQHSDQTAAKQPPQHPTMPSTPGAQGTKKGYQAETRQTVVYGNISNRGRSSVAAEATPLGRYKKKVSTAIGSRWNYYVQELSPNIGSVTVSFKITTLGKIINLRVISDTSNSALTDCTLRSIMDARIPPIPPDVAATLQDSSLEYNSFSFTIY